MNFKIISSTPDEVKKTFKDKTIETNWGSVSSNVELIKEQKEYFPELYFKENYSGNNKKHSRKSKR